MQMECIDLSTSELVTKNYQYFLDMLDEFLGGLDGTPTFIGGNNKLISKAESMRETCQHVSGNKG